jgi:hypothetical protein
MLQVQRHRRGDDDINIEDIVALSGLCVRHSWNSLKTEFSQPRYRDKACPLLSRLVKEGRVLLVETGDAFDNVTELCDQVSGCKYLCLRSH